MEIDWNAIDKNGKKNGQKIMIMKLTLTIKKKNS